MVDFHGSGDEQNDEEAMTVEDRILEELKQRGPQENVSHLAFTATSKRFSLYTMRQAFEEWSALCSGTALLRHDDANIARNRTSVDFGGSGLTIGLTFLVIHP